MSPTRLTNIGLFKCLCLDLGTSLRDVTITPDRLGRLKNELLLCAENLWPVDRTNTLRAELGQVFDLSGWGPLSDPVCFRDLYQILCWGLKIRVPATEQQRLDYVTRLKDNEASNRRWYPDTVKYPVLPLIRRLAHMLLANLDLSPEKVSEGMRHGPGAVYNKEQGEDKFFLSEPPIVLQQRFPTDLFFPNVYRWLDCQEDIAENIERFITARVALVPKDYKGPRGVFISPKEVMMYQLGCQHVLESFIRSSVLGIMYDPTRQDRSQERAYLGSVNRWYQTLDLSDASDLVSNAMIAYLLPRKIYLALAAGRPQFLVLPSGERVKLSMFAPMGDGKTFSVLSMVCALTSLAGVIQSRGYSLTAALPKGVLRQCAESISIIGDDISVMDGFDSVVGALESVGLKVNVGKSFVKGFFREACGMDAYKGTDCTPLRQKVDLNGPWSEETLIRAISFHNRLARSAGVRLQGTVTALRREIVRRCPMIAFTTRSDLHPLRLQTWDAERLNTLGLCPLLLWFLKWNPISKTARLAGGHKLVRYNSNLQRLEIKCVRVRGGAKYLPHCDARWRFSNFLMPKACPDTSPRGDEITPLRRVQGSPSYDRSMRRLAKAMEVRIPIVKSTLLEVGWQEL